MRPSRGRYRGSVSPGLCSRCGSTSSRCSSRSRRASRGAGSCTISRRTASSTRWSSSRSGSLSISSCGCALGRLERDIADVGYYSFVAAGEEAERLAGDAADRDVLLHRLMNERIEAWMRLATERLADSDVPLYLIPGNDDDFAIDPILDRDEFRPVNVDGKVVDMPGGLQLLSYGWTNSRSRWTTHDGRSS